MDAKNRPEESKGLEYYESLNYNITLEPWDDGEGVYWVARVVELPHCFIHGDSPEEALREIEEVKRDWIKSNLARGISISRPINRNFSGHISLRIPPPLHRMLFNIASAEDVSLNQYMTTALAGYANYPMGVMRSKKKKIKV